MGAGRNHPGRGSTQAGRCAVRLNFRVPVVAFAIAVGLVVLAGYFINISLLNDLRNIFLRWSVILVAIALLVGVANLFSVHWRKVSAEEPNRGFSLILLISLVLTIVVVGFFGPTHPWSMWIFNYIQVPGESSLLALLAVILVYAGARLLIRRLNLFSLIFLATALLVLIGTARIPGFEVPLLTDTRAWIERVPAMAGGRGILLGVALGTIATGLRVLTGTDRPYGG